ncbi:YisL family protein [Bacillus sp. DTU_2020_1000418_1_SI_GHA_SEK_038]|uniref:YisL family protein n=2 Tax=unclassified Bacillus (in: firmicutes) TaxID=185979 RepID=UPI0028EC5E73|nr:YisL family protein [Bacillus sp. DTU_2020_1000418_1_SI_GHA_SEK_038]WNS76822.1 YisL family protein [Bacillus sp. DTU_2020_1000418_1_SI_GHA_SEK_038]
MIHAHITTWVLALVLFFVALGLHKSGKARGLKVVQMVLRLFYILIIITGVVILSKINISSLYILKSLLGIVVIGMMEMIIVRSVKGKKTTMFWLLFLVTFILVLYLGFVKLPLTFLM